MIYSQARMVMIQRLTSLAPEDRKISVEEFLNVSLVEFSAKTIIREVVLNSESVEAANENLKGLPIPKKVTDYCAQILEQEITQTKTLANKLDEIKYNTCRY